MLPIRGLYEIAIRVRDLPSAESFAGEFSAWKSAFVMRVGIGYSCERAARLG